MSDSAVRVLRFRVENIDPDRRARWKELSEECQRAVNTIWTEWMLWHRQRGSDREIEASVKAMRDWRKACEGVPKNKHPKKPPKLDLKVMPPELARHIYAVLSERFPELHARVRVLLQNTENGKIVKRKAAHGMLPGWMAILLCRESLPSTRYGVPIPFNKDNSRIHGPREIGGNFELEIKLERDPETGKSITDQMVLFCKGRKVASQVAILKRILSDRPEDADWQFCGSSIQVDGRDVYALISFKRPLPKNDVRDPARVAFLRPSRTWPWKLRLPRANRRPGGTGLCVGENRRQLLTQRWSRQHNYRHAGSANKGHGRNRAMAAVTKLSQRWKDFVTTFNATVCRDVVQQVAMSGCGKLVYFQPSEGGQRFLAASGKVDGKRDSTAWDWHQVKVFLERRCQEFGVELEVRKSRV